MSYDQVNTRIGHLREKDLSELVQEAATGGWDEESFREGVKQSLHSGSFILIIVVDEINDDLRRTIRYVNECSESAFSLHALEMRRFQTDSTEILIPHLYGASSKPPPTNRKQWTGKEFFKVLGEKNADAKVVSVAEDLHKWAKKIADRIWFGTGIETGSITFHYLKNGKTISVFTVYTNGRLSLNYGWLSTQIGKGFSGVKLIWTVDAQKAKQFRESYYPHCDILLVQINWNARGGFYYIPLETQERLFKKIGKNKYIKLPKPGTNPRGVEISNNALSYLVEEKEVMNIEIIWERSRIDYNPYKRWVDYWKEE